MKDLSGYRKSYEKSELGDIGLPENPIQLFDQWFQETENLNGEIEANAMTIATIGSDGFPKSRVVLLKQFTAEGFVFYTNYNSEKGKALSKNPNVCLSFFWPALERQIIIKGVAQKTSVQDSDSYFNSRPEGSKLGALASHQSDIVPSREFLENKLKALQEEYKNKNIDRPEFWGGYLVKPQIMEFWQGRANRLHDRIEYRIEENNWVKNRLSP